MTLYDDVRVPLLGNPQPIVARARLVIAIVLAVYALTYNPPPGRTEPLFVPIFALFLVGMLVLASVMQLTKRAEAGQDPIPFILVDGLVTMALVSLYSFDPASFLFSLALGVTIEAAFALGLSAALVTGLALTIAYVIEELISNVSFDVPIEPADVVLRVLTLLGVTLVVGSLVGAARATRAFSSEREKAEHLEELDQMKTAFLAAVSHDLKNPLTAILGFSTTLEKRLDRLPPERVLEFLGHITRSARRLERMVSDLLDVDRMQRGVLSPNLRPTDMAELVRGIVQEIELNNRPVVIDAEDITAAVDPPKVERIVENLVTNAIKYTPDHTKIGLSVSRYNAGVLIAVDDEGEGIPDALKEKLFEPFQRAPGASAQAKGSGLGLSLVSSFAELHGGRAWVEDRPGGGSSFRVYLPGQATASA